MRVEFSAFVERDLDDIAIYIAEDNPARAVSCIQEIRVKIDAIGENPLLYQLRPEIGDGARMALVGQYAILFRLASDTVRIERVIYGGREMVGLYSAAH